jgi:hypothetical protein
LRHFIRPNDFGPTGTFRQLAIGRTIARPFNAFIDTCQRKLLASHLNPNYVFGERPLGLISYCGIASQQRILASQQRILARRKPGGPSVKPEMR